MNNFCALFSISLQFTIEQRAEHFIFLENHG